jgi:hypothetical protein
LRGWWENIGEIVLGYEKGKEFKKVITIALGNAHWLIFIIYVELRSIGI